MSTETIKPKYSVGASCKTTAANESTIVEVTPNIDMRVKAFSIVYNTGKGRTKIVSLNSKKSDGVRLITDAHICHFGAVLEREPDTHPCNFELRTSEAAWLTLQAPADGLTAGDVSIVLHGEAL